MELDAQRPGRVQFAAGYEVLLDTEHTHRFSRGRCSPLVR